MEKFITKLVPSKRTTTLCLVAVVLLAAVSGALALHHPTVKSTDATSNTASRAGSKTTGNGTVPSSSGAPPPSTSDADQQAAAHASTRPITDACKLLTQTVAVQLLGTSAKPTTPSDTSALQATGTTITVCAYATGSNNVQLVIRKPMSSLGTSQNATVFGSGKPSNAVKVSDYGQAAYWDPSKHTLNVLGDNNWYVISRGSNGNQAGAEAAARLLASGF